MNFFIAFKEGFLSFGKNISTIINSILLLIVYIIGVGPTAIIAKIVGKQFLSIGKKQSYWKAVPKREPDEFYRQF